MTTHNAEYVAGKMSVEDRLAYLEAAVLRLTLGQHQHGCEHRRQGRDKNAGQPWRCLDCGAQFDGTVT